MITKAQAQALVSSSDLPEGDDRGKMLILIAGARETITDPEKWIQREGAHNSDGHECRGYDPDARRWCAGGALEHEAGEDPLDLVPPMARKARDYLSEWATRVYGLDQFSSVNDGLLPRDVGHVLSASVIVTKRFVYPPDRAHKNTLALMDVACQALALDIVAEAVSRKLDRLAACLSDDRAVRENPLRYIVGDPLVIVPDGPTTLRYEDDASIDTIDAMNTLKAIGDSIKDAK